MGTEVTMTSKRDKVLVLPEFIAKSEVRTSITLWFSNCYDERAKSILTAHRKAHLSRLGEESQRRLPGRRDI